VAAHPALVRETQARGHSVQPHCWAHDRPHHAMTRSEIEHDLDRTIVAMRRAGIDRPQFWRPPFGAVKVPDTRAVAETHRVRLALWHVDPEDWRPDHTGETMLAHLRTDSVWRARGDSVVLLHDGRINTPRTSAENTLAVLEPLIDYVLGRGWKLGPLKTSLIWRLGAAVRQRPAH
jgi:peptidoglycan/xylan/chitin deacetylase (PgdA/CDA1 family)